MPSVWRLVESVWADDPLSGEGARLFGGRWNSRGQPCVYTSESRALAILEVLVHLGGVKPTVPFSLVEAAIRESMTVDTVAVSDLRDDWRSYPAPIE